MEAAERDRPPEPSAIEAARRKTGFDKLKIGPASATKRAAGLEISLDGIAKGYAIHEAVRAMRRYGLTGGLVDGGGDIECVGRPLGEEAWRLAVQHPRLAGRLRTLRLGGDARSRAVCTSGDYRRYITIAGRRYSHIFDPRSGRPAETASSVTVIGPDAFRADAWATALSVLGPDAGPPLLPARGDWQALLVVADGPRMSVRKSAGFDRYVVPD
jgi:thiamine biosynthesis lipoprotein